MGTAELLKTAGVGACDEVIVPRLWLPETERAADECLALPVGAGMSARELHRLVSVCNALGGLLPAAAA